jgi:hypothetical protein
VVQLGLGQATSSSTIIVEFSDFGCPDVSHRVGIILLYIK